MTDERVTYLFGNKGLLSKHLEGYREREGQMTLAECVIKALESEKHLLAEAPTGTGKSVATAIPGAIFSATEGMPVVYATSGITLQEQLISKDMPLIAGVLRGEVEDPEGKEVELDFSLLKGMSNYLCLQALEDEVRKSPSDTRIRQVKAWSRKTATGDKSELEFEDRDTWRRVGANSDDCSGPSCPYHKECFVFSTRRRAKKVNIIVTNYHMLFTDIAIKKALGPESGFLPPYEVLIMDEAHDAPDIAMDFHGFQLSYNKVMACVRSLTSFHSKDAQNAYKLTALAADDFFKEAQAIWQDSGENIIPDPLGLDKGLASALQQAGDAFVKIADSIDDESMAVRYSRKGKVCFQVALQVRESCFGYVEETNDEGEPVKRLGNDDNIGRFKSGRVLYFEDLPKSSSPGAPVMICCKAVNPQAFFREHIFSKKTVIMTSATLSTSSDGFRFIARNFGLEEGEYDSVVVPSPFDNKNVMSCIPDDFPSPSEDRRRHMQAVADSILRIALDLDKGGVLSLFTSHKSKHYVATKTRAALERAGVTVFEQGELPKKMIIREFKEVYDSGRKAVIFATQSFWQGVDIPGQALSVLTMDKIPFPTPDDPVLWYLDEKEVESFSIYSIPQAIIRTKQGVGRLIRREEDFGAIVIFDPRIHTARYGGLFEEAIPHYWQTTDPSDVPHFLRDKESETNDDEGGDREDTGPPVDGEGGLDEGGLPVSCRDQEKVQEESKCRGRRKTKRRRRAARS